MKLLRISLWRVAVAIGAGFMACGAIACQKEKTVVVRSQTWDKFVTDFEEAYFKANPPFAVYQGRHEFDGKLPDWTAEGIKKWVTELRTWRDRAATFDQSSLDNKQTFECDYLVAVANGDLFWLDTAEWPFKNPRFYAGPLDPNVCVAREYAAPTERLKAYTAYARSIPAAIGQIKANLRTPLPRPMWISVN